MVRVLKRSYVTAIYIYEFCIWCKQQDPWGVKILTGSTGYKVIALIGLKYLSLSMKKPSDYWFEKRKSPEVIARTIDHSGVLGIT